MFWTLNPKELESFNKAFELSQEISDINNWQLGRYIQHAVASCLFDKKATYPNKPFIYEQKLEERISEEERERIGKMNNQLVRQKIIERMNYINPILEQKKKGA